MSRFHFYIFLPLANQLEIEIPMERPLKASDQHFVLFTFMAVRFEVPPPASGKPVWTYDNRCRSMWEQLVLWQFRGIRFLAVCIYGGTCNTGILYIWYLVQLSSEKSLFRITHGTLKSQLFCHLWHSPCCSFI